MTLSLVSRSQYLHDYGQYCPRCGSDRLDFYDPENEFGLYNEGVTCLECHLDFRRLFQLTGYETLEHASL